MDVKILRFLYELIEFHILLYVWNLALSVYMIRIHSLLAVLCCYWLGYRGCSLVLGGLDIPKMAKPRLGHKKMVS